MDGRRKSKSHTFMNKRSKTKSTHYPLSTKKTPSNSAKSRRVSKALLANQNSVHHVRCFPIPMLNFLCGCGKESRKENNKIRKLSSRKLFRMMKKRMSEELRFDKEGKQSPFQEARAMRKNELDDSTKTEDVLPKGLTEPIPLDNLVINGNMRHLLTNLKMSSLLGCPSVPKTMSQIKVLLNSNPNLKSQLRQILGDNLKNENMKTIAELLASAENTEDTQSRNSSQDDIKPVTRTKERSENLVSNVYIQKLPQTYTCREYKNEKLTSNTRMNTSRLRCSKSLLKKDKSLIKKENQGFFTKLFSTFFRSSPSHQVKREKSVSKEWDRRKKNEYKQKSEEVLEEASEEESEEKFEEGPSYEESRVYKEWYKMAPQEAKERFRWEDYIRVKMYLNNIKNSTTSKDKKTKEVLFKWLKSFSKEINKFCPSPEEVASDPSGEATISDNAQVNEETTIGITKGNEDKEEEKQPTIEKPRITSDEMLNTGGGDVIVRLHILMKELLDVNKISGQEDLNDKGTQDYRDTGTVQIVQVAGQDNSYNYSNDISIKPDPDVSDCEKTHLEDMDMVAKENMRLLCQSFMEKLTNHNSLENSSYIPWQNKDFQVFCAPSVEKDISFHNAGINVLRNENLEHEKNDILSLIEYLKNIKVNPSEGECFSCVTQENGGDIVSRNSVLEKNKNKDLQSEPFRDLAKQVHKTPEINNVDTALKDLKHGIHLKKVSFNSTSRFGVGGTENESMEEEDNGVRDMVQPNKTLNEKEIILDTRLPGSGCIKDPDKCNRKNVGNSDTGLNNILEYDARPNRNSSSDIEDYKDDPRYVEITPELIEVSKFLISLAKFDTKACDKMEEMKNKMREPLLRKQSIAIQCKMPEFNQNWERKHLNLDLKNKIEGKSKSPVQITSEDGIGRGKTVSGDASKLNGLKLISSSSDSGVYSKPRGLLQFTSLPDVLNGFVFNSSKDQDETVESAESNLASCLSTSVSCQATHTPDIDDFSQLSTSDLSESNYKVSERSEAARFNSHVGNTSSSEKSQVSADSNNTAIIKNRIKKFLRKLKK